MRYANVESEEVQNGKFIGCSLYVQGCHFHCKNCFNSETWDFNGGREWTEDVEKDFLNLLDRPYIKRCSILGGEPLCNENRFAMFKLTNEIRSRFRGKQIWLYSGYTFEEILQCREQYKVLVNCDVLVDGQYIDELRDITLEFCGSSNQRIIDVQESLKRNEVVLWQES